MHGMTCWRCWTRAGFVAQRVTYVNALLAGPIAAVRLLQRWHLLRFSPGLYQDSLANALLRRALGCEAHWLRRWNLPLGISLCVLAQRSELPAQRKCTPIG